MTSSSATRRMHTLSNGSSSLNTMVTIRNNEGKVCGAKQVSKQAPLKKSKTILQRKKTMIKAKAAVMPIDEEYEEETGKHKAKK